MARNVTGNRHGTPTIVWLEAPARERLQELCSGFNAVPERLAGQLLTEALQRAEKGRVMPAARKEERGPMSVTEIERGSKPKPLKKRPREKQAWLDEQKALFELATSKRTTGM
ncbi:hypothetical protein OKW47_002101 [Paraburkholderia atlantica]